ncbi:SO_0444 family Cu/Zn efflux transporter [Rhodanobacter aciditrophus]|uniref:SO_0444 family Cu/Zn efflux transporter n=1 Tax=Rhodanobacter aciditrophus TaxID=1623218 RepID=A0ABW4B126_9GAMM
MSWFYAFIDLFLESAPWLVLGLIIAGLLKEFVPMAWMEKQLGQNAKFPVIKAALIGAPLPLCSCGVIPAAAGLRKAGASKGATTSFLISTPETGVDSIALSWVLLGPFMAIARPIAAIFSAITAGWLVGKEQAVESLPEAPKSTSSCCASNSCHSTPNKLSLLQRFKRGIHYAATEMVDDIAIWLLIGIGFAAAVQAFVPASFLAQWGTGLLAMLVMVIISIPMYICATASTPIAAGLLVAGVSPGAVLVFMLAGPATNIATLGVVYKLLGKRALWSYLAGVLGCALAFGWAVDWLFSTLGWQLDLMGNVAEQAHASIFAIVSGVILGALMVWRIGLSLMPNQGHNHSHSH